MSSYPLFIEAAELEKCFDDKQLVIIDLCKTDTYKKHHIPGAVHVDYGRVVKVNKPIMGLMPDDEHLLHIISSCGIANDSHVIAYDDEGGGKAARFLWTLEVLGHEKVSLLNGGIIAWLNGGHPITTDKTIVENSDFNINKNESVFATRDYLLSHLDDQQVQLLDARSLAEYRGTKRFAQQGGHIPGAIHYEWTDAMDKHNNLCLHPLSDIDTTLSELGFDKNKTIVTYCHSHHRSSFSYYVLKAAGFKQIRGYAGSWSEWGNDLSLPVSI